MIKILVCVALLCQCVASLDRIKRGKKPPAAPEQGPFYGHFGNYLVVNTKQSWGSAKQYCEAPGGKLAQPDSSLANTELIDVLSSNGISGNLWIGLTDTWQEGLLAWTDGTEAIYTNLAGSPGNSASKDCVLTKSGKKYQWYWERCGRKFPFICQLPPGCPDGTEPVSCYADPCSTVSCSNYPDAICRANYCGGCNAEFYNSAGMLVDCGTPSSGKPGTCPVQPATGVGACSQDCGNDYDCSGNEKCCPNGCGVSCTAPV